MFRTSKPLYISVLLLILSISITSCKNFMNADETVKQIKDTIEYANSPVFSVRIAPENSAHGIVVSGVLKEGVRVTDKFDLEFSLAADYTFLGWDAVKKDDHSVSYNDYVEFSSPKSLSTSVKIINGNDDIYKGQLQLRPYCRPSEKGTINITSSYGSVSYNSESEYKEGTLLKLSFNSNPGYGFTHWAVLVGDSYDTTGEYVQIENPKNTVTDATFLKHPDNNEVIYIIPVCVERPVAISKAPQLSESGVYRDSRIKVLFDSPMDEGSIYWTSNSAEYTALGQNITPLSSSADESKIYGYTKVVNGVTKKYYKNIEIKDQNTGLSLLDYFDEPKFSSPNMLIIPTAKTKKLPRDTELLVTLSSGFYTKTSDGYDVSLDGKVFWTYMVNDKTDSSDPSWNSLEVKAMDGVFLNRQKQSYNPYNFAGTWTSLTECETETAVSPNQVFGKNGFRFFARNGIIKVNADFTDVGTGPAAIHLEIAEVSDTALTYTYKNTMDLPIRISGNKGLCQQPTADGDDFEGVEIKLTDENGAPLSDGAYRLNFVAEDGAGKTTDFGKYFYVCIDNTNDPVSKPSGASAEENSITFSGLTNPSLNYYFYQIKKPGQTEYEDPVRITSDDQAITGLEPGNTYYFKYFKSDEHGNSNNFVEFKKNTKPVKPQNVTATVSQTSNKKVTVNWKKPADPNYKGATVTAYKYDPQTGSTSGDAETVSANVAAVNNQEEYSYTFDNLTPGYRYEFKVSSYDSGDDYTTSNIGDGAIASIPSGNSTVTNVVLPPDPPKNFSLEYYSSYPWFEKLLIYWAKPAQGFVNAYYYSYIDTSNPSAEWSNPKLIYNPQTFYDDVRGYIHYDELDLTNEMAGRPLKFKIWSAVVNSSDKTTKYEQSRDGQEINYFVPPLNLDDFRRVSNTNTTITFQWDQVECNYDGAKIGYKKTSDNSYTWVTVPKVATTHTLESLTGGTEYDICFYTYAKNGNATVQSGTGTIDSTCTSPNPITNLKAEPISGSKVKFTWTKPVGNYSQIKFYNKYTTQTSDYYSCFKTISISEDDGEFEWELSSALQKDIFNVKAIVYTGYDYSPDSEEIIAYSGIDPVTNIGISNVGTSRIDVSWNDPESAFDRVNVSYKPKGSNDTPITSTITPNQNIHSKIMQDLSVGTEYEITIETVVTKKNGITYTNPLTIYVYTRPYSQSATSFEYSKKLKIRWTPVSDPLDGFMIFRSAVFDLSKAIYVDTVDKTTNEYIIENLTSGTKYYIWIVPYVGPVPDISSVKQGKTYNTGSTQYCSCYGTPQ